VGCLGPGLIGYRQKMTVAAKAMTEKKTVGKALAMGVASTEAAVTIPASALVLGAGRFS
jgi:hypothetical protein